MSNFASHNGRSNNDIDEPSQTNLPTQLMADTASQSDEDENDMQEGIQPSKDVTLLEPSAGATGEPVILSKTAQKRMLKAQRREALKGERRAKGKAAKKAKKAEKRRKEAEEAASQIQEREEGKEDNVVAEGDVNDPHGVKREREGDGGSEEKTRRVKRRKGEDGSVINDQNKQKKESFGAKVVIDLGFDDKMTEREIISMVAQNAYCYSLNRKSNTPFSALLFTSLNGRTKGRLDLLGTYQHWKGVEWWEEGYEQLWQVVNEEHTTSTTDENACTSAQGEFESPTYTCPVTKIVKPRTTSHKEKVVYLTADSNTELLELDPEETYVIGGIVDKNRYKALCENKARSQGIRTARLPIGVYLKELPTRKVLTVNQVFDILLKWVEFRDWRRALYAVIPQRKFESLSKSARRKKASAKSDDERVMVEDVQEEGEATDAENTEPERD
ncbi:tRNA (guanine(9)-N(1))-methyltransferase [Serendipita sp. 411]|nr:tRNA (guanine(9)-N(1))-methyltransferase [Serendipita sp. 400]KAG8846071.1 tRNA (guanine(9)-N(1))-methyltransferase [Serendipita sp. 411]